ncbi:antitoxin [Blastococcus sp. HT6-30]|uniref:antitoxin n=1 Tax=Blastococcus sp. HT6-30 TaxID=3144843 RepID=UPI00321C09E1
MRTTIDLPEDIHRVASAIARDSGSSLSDTLTRLLRAAPRRPGRSGAGPVSTSPRTGLQVASIGRVITSEDVRSLADDE